MNIIKKIIDSIKYRKYNIQNRKTWNKVKSFEGIYDHIDLYHENETFLFENADIIDRYHFVNMAYKKNNLSEKFMDIFFEILSPIGMVMNQKLSQNFIEKHQDDLNWNLISECQTLDEAFIEKFHDKVNWDIISKHQSLSNDFRQKWAHKMHVHKHYAGYIFAPLITRVAFFILYYLFFVIYNKNN